MSVRSLLSSWNPPDSWRTITTLDTHTAGEPLRIITGGMPPIEGTSILAKRAFAKEHLDVYRKMLMWEPRGHREMYGCILTEATNPDSDFGVLFLHNEGYSTMCGHAIIALGTVAVTTGLVAVEAPTTSLRIDTPAGTVQVRVDVSDGAAERVHFVNVPSFVVALDQTVEVSGVGTVTYDLAFGGAFYAYVDAAAVGLSCSPEEYDQLVEHGRRIKRAIMASRTIDHPEEPGLGFLYGVIFVAPSADPDVHSRNVCIFADGQVDRSPTGTGVSGRIALHAVRDGWPLDAPMTIESILGTRFQVRAREHIQVGHYRGVVPEVSGAAYITGIHTFCIDPGDPLGDGFLL